MSSSPQIAPLKAALWIVISLVLISGSFSVVVVYYRSLQNARSHDLRYNITALVHSCKGAEPLKTACFAEILNLSADRAVNLYAFDVPKAHEKLLNFSVIKKAIIKKIPPNMLYVEYSLRIPIAYISDYFNASMDAEGVLMPFNPYYTPKNIPSLYFGFDQSLAWGEKLQGEKFELVKLLLKVLEDHFISDSMQVESLDVSNAFSLNYGAREFVVTLSKKVESFFGEQKIARSQKRTLRLTLENYLAQLANFKELCGHMDEEVKNSKDRFSSHVIIDMRVSDVAFICDYNN